MSSIIESRSVAGSTDGCVSATVRIRSVYLRMYDGNETGRMHLCIPLAARCATARGTTAGCAIRHTPNSNIAIAISGTASIVLGLGMNLVVPLPVHIPRSIQIHGLWDMRRRDHFIATSRIRSRLIVVARRMAIVVFPGTLSVLGVDIRFYVTRPDRVVILNEGRIWVSLNRGGICGDSEASQCHSYTRDQYYHCWQLHGSPGRDPFDS